MIGISIAFANLNASASTNTNTTVSATCVSTNSSGAKESGGYELTLGGGGSYINGKNNIGLDISLSSNPFESRPEVWVGLSQGVYWEPSFSGATDLFADWNTHLIKELYLNTGWSAGISYDLHSSPLFRTGPEASLQYYTSDNAFVYAGLNYSIYVGDRGHRPLTYTFGIGLSF